MDEQDRRSIVWLSGAHGRLQGLNIPKQSFHSMETGRIWNNTIPWKTLRAFKPSCVWVGIFKMIFIILHISHLIILWFFSHFSRHCSCCLQQHYFSCFYMTLHENSPSPKVVKWIWDYKILMFCGSFCNLLLSSRFHLCLYIVPSMAVAWVCLFKTPLASTSAER